MKRRTSTRETIDRWVSCGVPEYVAELIVRGETRPSSRAIEWYDSPLSTNEILAMRKARRRLPSQAAIAEMRKHGLPTNLAFVSAWEGVDPTRITDAIDRGFTHAASYLPWAETDADVEEAAQLSKAGLDTTQRLEALTLLRQGTSAEAAAYRVKSRMSAKEAASWKRAGVPAETAAAWAEAGFKPAAAASWLAVTMAPEVAARLVGCGVTPEMAREHPPDGGWTDVEIRRLLAIQAGATPDDAPEWAESGVPEDVFGEWISHGFSVTTAQSWAKSGFAAEQAVAWAEAHVPPGEARAWERAGVEPKRAGRRRAAGFTPPPVKAGG